ncbi:hypothetical protein PV797_20660 [Clostridiaceae bacterium M8S5]|nr:hypothetical protein PV797_20660 [Clostridiaceae bacterium M8S5]
MSRNHKQDKIRILEMIEKGQITSSDGFDLLEALNANYSKENDKTIKINVYDKNKKLKSNASIPLTILELSANFISKYISNVSGSKHYIDKDIMINAVRKNKKGIIFEFWDEESEKRIEISIN